MKIKVAVHGKPFTIEDKPKLEGFFFNLDHFGFIPVLSQSFAEICVAMDIDNVRSLDTYQNKSDLKGVKFAFSFGGDGTLLELVTHVGNLEIPIIGVNMGRLGFLATTPLEDIENAVQYLSKNEYEIDERILIQMISDQEAFKEKNFALNDFAILKRDSSSMIKVKVFLDDVYLNTY